MSSETPIIDELTAEIVAADGVVAAGGSGSQGNDDNGFVDVHDLIRNEVEAAEAEAAAAVAAAVAQAQAQEQFVKPLEQSRVVVAEPDSSSEPTTSRQQPQQPTAPVRRSNESVESSKRVDEPKDCSQCPMRQTCSFTRSTCNLCESIADYLNTHQCVKSLLFWENPKVTGALLVVSLLFIELIAANSLIWNFGALTLLAMTVAGSYRLYAFVMNRVKGVEDTTIPRLAALKLELPHDTLRNTVDCVERHGNELLNQFKLLVLWNNVTNSAVAYLAAYFVYSVGCCFNTLTLLSLLILSAFTLPKVYTVYKVQIDSGLMKAHNTCCDLVSKVQDKLPMIFKKKRN